MTEENKKSTWKIIKEIWKNPRYRSLITLGIYIVFFILIITILGVRDDSSSDNSDVIYSDSLKNLYNMTDYEYEYRIKYQNSTGVTYNIIEGKKENDEDKFILNDSINYTIVNDNLYVEDGNVNNLEIDIIKLQPKYLYDYLQDSNYNIISSGNETIKEYAVNNINLLNTQVDNIGEINIKTYEEKNKINKIEIDITNLITQVNKEITSCVITIKYNN